MEIQKKTGHSKLGGQRWGRFWFILAEGLSQRLESQWEGKQLLVEESEPEQKWAEGAEQYLVKETQVRETVAQ